jgi:hypothetical protein
MWNMEPSAVPPPVRLDSRTAVGLAVPVDFLHLFALVRFDVASTAAEVSATAELRLDGPDGCPVFDLRQPVGTVRLDGRALPPDALGHRDMGAGYDARMRVADVVCEAGSTHELELAYRLGTPDAVGARPIGWSTTGDGVTWDLWMSDLEPGRYLEMWLPSNLCHDKLAIELVIEVVGTDRPHLLLANGAVVEEVPGCRWAVRYPPTCTSLSPLVVLAPADEVDLCRTTTTVAGRPLGVTVACLADAGTDLAAVTADTVAWLSYFGARYGAWGHGDEFLAVIWGFPRGMEYDGATTACAQALEHEVFHSWFGRGIKPASAADGWIDEAMASWATATSRSAAGRFRVMQLGLDETPSLLCPPHPWSRHTPSEAYTAGSRLLAGVAHMAGGAAELRSALAAWYQNRSPAGGTTRALAEHLGAWCGRDLGPWWDRYVYGGTETG